MKINFRFIREKLPHFILFFLIAILPAVTYMVLFHNPLAEYEWCSNTAIESDLFLIAKGRIFLIICLFAVIWGGWYCIHKRERRLPVEVFLLLGYAILCLLSFLFSKNRYIGLYGVMEQHETIFILLGYCTICFCFFLFSKYCHLSGALCASVLIGCGIQIIICLFQYCGRDLLSFSFIQRILIPASIRQGAEKIELFSGINEYNRVYGTLYNPNYLGLYTNLMLPLVIVTISTGKKLVIRIFATIIAVLLIFVTFASGSKAFILTGAAQLLFTALLLRKTIKKHWKHFAVGICLFLACFIGYNAANQNRLTQALVRALTIQKQEYALEDITVSEESVRIDYKAKAIHLNFIFNENQLDFWGYNENGEDYVTYLDETGYLRMEDNALSSWTISAGRIQDQYICIVTIDGTPWYFTRTEEGYQYITPGGKECEIIKADGVFTGYEKVLSKRGYIWGRSIPLLKDNLILGNGPGTYMLQFPQNDYVAAVNTGYYNTLISRPHNAYLQIGIQTGVLSMILYVSLFIVYAIKTMKCLYSYQVWTASKRWQLAILISLTGYMIATLTSDSLIVTAPIYWVLLGIGVGFYHKKKF